MSLKTLDKPQIVERPRSYADPRTAVRPEVGFRSRVEPVKRAKAKSKSNLAVSAAAVAACFVSSMVVTGLWGNVELEKARYNEREAIARANEAKRVEAGLRTRVEALTSGTSVSEWAQQNGFQVFQATKTPATPETH